MTHRTNIPMLALAGLVLMSACGSEELPEPDLQEPVAVKVYQAQVKPLEQQTAYAGTVQPIDQVQLSTKIMGWVERIYFQEGESFSKGATLVALRSEDLQAKRAQAEAAIAEATIHFQNAKRNLERIEALHKNNAATQKELEDMRSAFASAEARKIAAEKMLVEVEEMLKYAVITAPFAGVVARKFLEPGDLANPGQPLLEIENAGKVKIIAKTPESAVQGLSVGMPVYVTVQAAKVGANGHSREGVINKVAPAADAMSRQFDIEVVLDNPDGSIKSGMFARVLMGGSGAYALPVPQSAVFRRGQLTGLFVVGDDMHARLRWVRTGSEQGSMVDILSGLNEGETVVAEHAGKLVDGQRVEVVQ